MLLPHDADQLRSGALLLALPGGDPVAAVLYQNTRAELDLDASPITEVLTGRELPAFHSAYNVDELGEVTPSTLSRQGLRLPPIDWKLVIANGGCSKEAADQPGFIIDAACVRERVR